MELKTSQALIAKPSTSLTILHVTILYRHLLTVIWFNRVLDEDIKCHTRQLSAFIEVLIWVNVFFKSSVEKCKMDRQLMKIVMRISADLS